MLSFTFLSIHAFFSFSPPTSSGSDVAAAWDNGGGLGGKESNVKGDRKLREVQINEVEVTSREQVNEWHRWAAAGGKESKLGREEEEAIDIFTKSITKQQIII